MASNIGIQKLINNFSKNKIKYISKIFPKIPSAWTEFVSVRTLVHPCRRACIHADGGACLSGKLTMQSIYPHSFYTRTL
jgi:hypothetical protein